MFLGPLKFESDPYPPCTATCSSLYQYINVKDMTVRDIAGGRGLRGHTHPLGSGMTLMKCQNPRCFLLAQVSACELSPPPPPWVSPGYIPDHSLKMTFQKCPCLTLLTAFMYSRSCFFLLFPFPHSRRMVLMHRNIEVN